jgi:hypothetical protein
MRHLIIFLLLIPCFVKSQERGYVTKATWDTFQAEIHRHGFGDMGAIRNAKPIKAYTKDSTISVELINMGNSTIEYVGRDTIYKPMTVAVDLSKYKIDTLGDGICRIVKKTEPSLYLCGQFLTKEEREQINRIVDTTPKGKEHYIGNMKVWDSAIGQYRTVKATVLYNGKEITAYAIQQYHIQYFTIPLVNEDSTRKVDNSGWQIEKWYYLKNSKRVYFTSTDSVKYKSKT